MSRPLAPTVSPSLSHRLNVLALVLTALIVVTGGAVRLTGSGLGCSDWPDCSVGHLTPPVQFHSLVEFGNRMVTVVMVIVVAAAFLGAVFRVPRRRDLIWLSGGLVAGVLAQAVIGGIVVYTKLNPYVVMVHFVATIVLLVDAVVLVHRSTRDYTPSSARLLVPRPLIRLFYGLLALLGLVVAAGSATSGAGPTPGTARPAGRPKDPGRPARHGRAPFEPRPAADRCHHRPGGGPAHGDVPERVRRSSRIWMVVMVAQAAVGYTQYFTHQPAPARRGAPARRHTAGDRRACRPSSPARTTHRKCWLPRPNATRQDRASPSVPISALGSPSVPRPRPHRLAA